MRVKLLPVLLVLPVVSLTVTPALGRLIESWPYERLFKESDLVVIATAQSTADSPERLKDNPWKEEFLGQTTTFAVKSTLKGKPNADTIQVLHYKLRQGVQIKSGPLLVSFRTKGPFIDAKEYKVQLGTPDYLLFLKAGKDGRFEPVSGQVDPELSVREMYKPLPDLGEK